MNDLLSAGSVLELLISDLSLEGGGIARHARSEGSIVIFTDRGLPGEKVLAAIERVKARHAFARVEKTLAPAPNTQAPHCEYAGDCGGCSWPGLAYADELAWKERQLRETLRRIGKIEAELLDDPALFAPISPSPQTLHYRNKMEFAFGPGAESGILLGLRLRNSHRILEIEDCPLAARSAREILELTRSWLRESGIKEKFPRFLVLRQPEYAPAGAEQCLVEFISSPCAKNSPEALAVRGLAEKLRGQCTGFVHSIRADAAPVAYGEKILFRQGQTEIREEIGGYLLEAPAGAFLQVNTRAAGLLQACIRGLLEESHLPDSALILDAYCGVGGIGLSLIKETSYRLLGIENNPAALRAAKVNAELNEAQNAEFILGDAAEMLGDRFGASSRTSPGRCPGPARGLSPLDPRYRGFQRASGPLAEGSGEAEPPCVLIADPPRAGLSAEMIQAILRAAPRKLILVSCNPATLARDLQLLAGSYRIKAVRAVDMFPHTPHLEAAVGLELKESAYPARQSCKCGTPAQICGRC